MGTHRFGPLWVGVAVWAAAALFLVSAALAGPPGSAPTQAPAAPLRIKVAHGGSLLTLRGLHLPEYRVIREFKWRKVSCRFVDVNCDDVVDFYCIQRKCGPEIWYDIDEFSGQPALRSGGQRTGMTPWMPPYGVAPQ